MEAGTRGRAGSQARLHPGGNTLGWPITSAPGHLSLRQRPAWFQRTKLEVWWSAAGKEEKPRKGPFSSWSPLWATGPASWALLRSHVEQACLIERCTLRVSTIVSTSHMGLVGDGNVAPETEGRLFYIYFILINFYH